MIIQAVRGAVGIERNGPAEIERGVHTVMNALIDENRIEERHIVSVQFSVTKDLTALNPATAFRNLGYSKASLFCCQEPDIDGGMPKIIRVLLTVYCPEGTVLKPCYVQGAEKLRPDLTH